MSFKVAVYGTLRPKSHNNGLLRDAKHLGTGKTVNKYRLGARYIPFVSQVEKEDTNNVVIDLYEVTAEELVRLDRLENNPNWYKREEIPVNVNGTEHTAWLYFNETENYGALKTIINGDYLNPEFKPQPVAQTMGV